jgi:hypothetical protein
VLTVSYVYQFPTRKYASRLVDTAVNGWGIQGVTVAQSGEPFSVYDFSGTAAGIYFSADDFVTNPILPLAPGISPKQATTGGTDQAYGSGGAFPGTRIPYVNPNDFTVPLLNPGQSGVPPCGPSTSVPTQIVCDTQETGYGNNGRNIFRAPFQTRFDLSVFKNFRVNERVALSFKPMHSISSTSPASTHPTTILFSIPVTTRNPAIAQLRCHRRRSTRRILASSARRSEATDSCSWPCT